MWMIIWVVSLFVLTIIGLIYFQRYPSRVFGCTLLAMFCTGAVSANDILTSFSNKGLLTLVLLMICSLALEKTRILRCIVKLIIKPNYNLTWLKLFGVTALSSALLNNTAIVSSLMSSIRNNPYHPASKLLLPLSYAAILGGTLTLVGTSTNLIVNSLVIDAGFPPIGFFDFTLIGFALVTACGISLYLSRKYLPSNVLDKADFSSYMIYSKVQENSLMIGQTVEKNGLRHLESLFLAEIIRGQRVISPVVPNEVIEKGDRLIFTGDITKVMQLQQFNGLSLFADDQGLPINNLTEVLIKPESVLVGQTLKESGFRALFNAAVVAIKRDGKPLFGKLGVIKLEAGDFLVLAVGDDFHCRNNLHKNFIILSGVEPEDRLMDNKEWLVGCGFIAAITMSAFGFINLFSSLFVFLGFLILTGCLSQAEIIRRLPIDIWLIVGSALCISQALTNSGSIDLFDIYVKNHLSGLPAFWALVGIYVLTWCVTELVTNNAAAALMLPIGLATASSLDANPMAFIMVVAFASSASFLSPYGYQTNLMVYNVGQYTIRDFLRQGMAVSVIYALVCIAGIVMLFGV
ncbi:SLC13 family permease [Vibrio mimicus]|uniref:SLC13 family permease n=1 Tax=Vibrio mimicus TaxID=674 RepID=UPI0001BACE0D|nr:SLC13 family permease [Vibrio mimicus]EEY46442.1 sulfate permease Trk-type [Vibrio mimicus VM223]